MDLRLTIMWFVIIVVDNTIIESFKWDRIVEIRNDANDVNTSIKSITTFEKIIFID